MPKNTALRNSLADAQTALYNGGSLRCLTKDGDVVVEFVFQDPAFAASAAGAADLNGTPISGNIKISGTIAYAEMWSNGGTYRVENLSVGTSPGLSNVVISTLTPTVGNTMNLTELIFEESSTVGVA